MTWVRLGLVALPVVTLVLTLYAVRPVARAVAPVRLATARAAVLTGAYGVASVEVLSALGWLTVAGVIGAWVVALVAAAAGAWWRRRRDGGLPPIGLRDRIRSFPRGERAIAAAVLALVGAELVLALASPPNTYDSQTYHLPRIEHWAFRGSVDLYPTGIHRQITYPPGAEFLLLHLRLMTGVDTLYNLLQWACGVLCVVLVTRLAAQLGVPRRGQLLAALVVASVPMVVLQSSSTQTDLVVAAWVTCVATLVLDGVGRTPLRRPDLPTVLLIGAAAGLVALTQGDRRAARRAAAGVVDACATAPWLAAVAGHRAAGRCRAADHRRGAGGVRAAVPADVRDVRQPVGSGARPRDAGDAAARSGQRAGQRVADRAHGARGARAAGQPVGRRPGGRRRTSARARSRRPAHHVLPDRRSPTSPGTRTRTRRRCPLQALLLLIGAGAAVIRGARPGETGGCWCTSVCSRSRWSRTR